METLGLIEIIEDKSKGLTHRIINKDASLFAVNNSSAIQVRRSISGWTRLRSVGCLLTESNHRIVKGGKRDWRGTFLSKPLLAKYLSWIINNDRSAECVGNILKELGINSGIRILHSRAEIEFGENIINNLFSDYEVISQFPVFNGKYFIDWYIPELNIAIEYDEYYHKNNKKADNERQEEIEKELGCRFLRHKE